MPLSPSYAYKVLLTVAINTTLCLAPLISKFPITKGCAYTSSSTNKEKSFLNWVAFTVVVFNTVSLLLCPVLPLSLCCVVTDICCRLVLAIILVVVSTAIVVIGISDKDCVFLQALIKIKNSSKVKKEVKFLNKCI